MKLFIKKLRENAAIPERATPGSSGLDLYACIDHPITINAGMTVIIPTGLSAKPQIDDTALLIYPRSGLASRYGISLANCVGVVDSDYRGEICVPLFNHGNTPFTVEPGMRIAQLVVTPVIFPDIVLSDTLDETLRGLGGFGSSGLK